MKGRKNRKGLGLLYQQNIGIVLAASIIVLVACITIHHVF